MLFTVAPMQTVKYYVRKLQVKVSVEDQRV